jgi:hypothetical protein
MRIARNCDRSFTLHHRSIRYMASREVDELPEGSTNTVRIRHPRGITRRGIQEACMKAVGEQSYRIRTPKDDLGFKKDYSFLVMSSAAVVEQMVRNGIEIGGETYGADRHPDTPDVDRVGNTTSLFVRVQEGSQMEKAEREMLRVAGEKPLKLLRLRSGIVATFGSPLQALLWMVKR